MTGGNTTCDAVPDQNHHSDDFDTFIPSDPFIPLPPSIYTGLLQCLAADPSLSEYTYYRSTQSLIIATNLDTPVLSSDAQVIYAITHQGRRFSDAGHSFGDSNVMFYSEQVGLATRKSFGQIQRIFNHRRRLRSGKFVQQIFLALYVYPPLSPDDTHLDPYNDLHVGARLVYAAPNPVPVVIPLNDVICHVAICPFKKVAPSSPSRPCSVVVALDEVSQGLISGGQMSTKQQT